MPMFHEWDPLKKIYCVNYYETFNKLICMNVHEITLGYSGGANLVKVKIAS